jgi:hypothetical protein
MQHLSSYSRDPCMMVKPSLLAVLIVVKRDDGLQ